LLQCTPNPDIRYQVRPTEPRAALQRGARRRLYILRAQGGGQAVQRPAVVRETFQVLRKAASAPAGRWAAGSTAPSFCRTGTVHSGGSP
jgi:hypothetical protein